MLAVYNGTAVGALSRVQTDDDGECGLGSIVTFDAKAGTKYRIALDGYGTAAGSFSIHLDVPPPGDRRRSALALTDGVVRTGSTQRATAEDAEPAHAGRAASRSVWFRVTPERTGRIVVSACGSRFDTVLAAYDGAAPVAANNDNAAMCRAGSSASAVTFAATAGNRYDIALDGPAGDYRIRALFNDDQDAGTPIRANAVLAGSTVGASGEPAEPSHGGAGQSVWFALNSEAAGRTVTLDTCTGPLGGLDTVLAAYAKQGGSLVPLAASDDTVGCGPAGQGAALRSPPPRCLCSSPSTGRVRPGSSRCGRRPRPRTTTGPMPW